MAPRMLRWAGAIQAHTSAKASTPALERSLVPASALALSEIKDKSSQVERVQKGEAAKPPATDARWT
jgi:hypothetical protein